MNERTDPRADKTSDRTLIVLDPDDPDATMQQVLGRIEEEPVSILLVYPQRRFYRCQRAYDTAGIDAPLSVTQFEAKAERTAERLAQKYFEDGTEYETIGGVGDVTDYVNTFVSYHDCSTVVAGETVASWRDRLRRIAGLPSGIDRVLPRDVVRIAPD